MNRFFPPKILICAAALALARGPALAAGADDPLADIGPYLDQIISNARRRPGFVSSLVQELRGSADRKERIRLVHLLGKIWADSAHPEVIPALTAEFRDSGGPSGGRKDIYVRWEVCKMMGNFGPAAAEAAPDFLRASIFDPDGDVRRDCGAAFGRLLPQGGSSGLPEKVLEMIPELAGWAKNGNELLRVRACETLGMMGPQARQAADDLLMIVIKAGGAVSKACSEALRKINPSGAIGSGGTTLPEPGQP